MYTIYGIKNCDKIKKIIKEATSFKLNFEFVDFKKNPPSNKKLKQWKKELGQIPVNNKSRVFKEFKEEYESSTEENQIHLLIENTSAIVRPIIEKDGCAICSGVKSIQDFL